MGGVTNRGAEQAHSAMPAALGAVSSSLNPNMTMLAQRRQLATLLAALHLLKSNQWVFKLRPELLRIATDNHSLERLSGSETAELWEELRELGDEMKLTDEKIAGDA
jgi:hypothetical protein